MDKVAKKKKKDRLESEKLHNLTPLKRPYFWADWLDVCVCVSTNTLIVYDLKKKGANSVTPKINVTVYDATAKMPSGLLNGNVNQLGDYDECVGVEGEDGVRGRYCLAYLQLDVDGSRSDLAHLHRLLHSHYAFRSNFSDVSIVAGSLQWATWRGLKSENLSTFPTCIVRAGIWLIHETRQRVIFVMYANLRGIFRVIMQWSSFGEELKHIFVQTGMKKATESESVVKYSWASDRGWNSLLWFLWDFFG